MKCAAILSLLVAGASAFAPSAKVAHSSSQLSMGFENEVGAQPPLGYWDPLNFCLDQDQAKFDRLRYVELKHGRIAMLAILGNIHSLAGVRLPGKLDYQGHDFTDVPAGFKAIEFISTPGLVQVIAFIGFLELFVMKDVKGTGQFPGDFRNGFDFGWDKYSEEEKLEKRAIELNNGRAAQMGILGLMVHEQLGNLGQIVPVPN
jgi:hypothetical protein